MAANPCSRLAERLLETLSLVEHYEEQSPPCPITQAALKSMLQELIAELKIFCAETERNGFLDKNH